MGTNTDESDPFARMESTHRRIEQRIAELLDAVDHLSDASRRDELMGIIDDTVGFFGRGGRRHVEDEENTLFPRIAGFSELAPLLRTLEAEHNDHQRIEEALRLLVASFLGKDPDAAGEAKLGRLARELATLYETHIRREEKELFPACRRLLSQGEIRAMGEEMMARRPDRGKDKK